MDPVPSATSELLDSIDDAVICTNPAGIITFWNRQATALYGWTADEALGRHVVELLHNEEDHAVALERIEASLRGEKFETDKVSLRKDGTSFIGYLRLYPVRAATGEITGLIGLSSDVTEARALDRLTREMAEDTQRGEAAGAVPTVVAIVRPRQDGSLEWLYTNAAWQEMFRDRRAPYASPDLNPDDLQEMTAAVLSGNTVSRELRVRTNGGERWMRFRLTPGSVAGGSVNIVTIVGIDIDSERQAMEVEEQRSAVLRQLADAVPALLAVSVPDPAGGMRVVFLNRRWQEYTGLSEGDVFDDAARARLDHPDDQGYFPGMRQVPSTDEGARFEGDFRFRRSDGAYRWHRVVHQVVRDDREEVVAYVTVALDMHESREAEQARDRLAAIVNSTSDAVVSQTLEGIITSWNRGAERLFGYSAEEVVGQSVDMYVPEDERQRVREVYARLARGESPEPFETERLTKDGRRLAVLLTASPLPDEGGNVIGVAAILRDITAEKRMLDALRRANAIKEEFLSLVSHELRTPLTTVVGLAHVLARRAGRYDEETQEIHADLFREGARLQSIIENMLMLTRLDSQPVALDPVHPERLVQRVASRFAERGHACPVETEFEPGLPPIAGQEGWIEQILDNLLSNADKYGAPGTPIVVSVRREDHSIVLRVRDHGRGISEEDRPYVFEAFFRSRTATSVPGAGLGLAVCKRLAELQNGEIRALDAEGGGTVMELRLGVLNEGGGPPRL